MSMSLASLAFSFPSSIAKSMGEDLDKENMAIIFNRYKDKLVALPKENGWTTESIYMYQGFWFDSMHIASIESLMALQDTFKARPSDIYLVTLPKAGTTWLKALTFALAHRTQYKNNDLLTHPLLVSNPHICLPSIEFEIFKKTPTYEDPHLSRLFATHIPYTALPQSIIDCGCRFVYLYRNPKDVLVSLFHFANKLRDKSLGQMTFEEAFELFSKGIMPCGSYWDHVKGYHKVGLEQEEKILFLKYEDMITDTTNTVKRLAKFLGCPFTEVEEAVGAIQGIIDLCSFEKLSKVNKHESSLYGIPHDAFFREGKVGDWTNHLTDDMSRILDEITEEKFHALDISF